MTFQSFIETFNGKYIDFDGAYGAQCMDEMHYYCVQVLGLADGRILAAPCAKDVYNNFDSVFGHELFERIPNTPTGVPNEGDVMFWGNGTWGHVAIFIEGDANSFRSFDQNYPTGSPCHVQNHTSYSGVLGWLRFKKDSAPASPELQACQTQLQDEIKKKNDNYNWGKELESELEGVKSQVKHYMDFETQTAITLGCENDEAKIIGEITKLIGVQDTLTNTLKGNEQLKNDKLLLKGEISTLKLRIEGLENANGQQVDMLETLRKDKEALEVKLAQQGTVQALKIIARLPFQLFLCTGGDLNG